MLCMMEQTLIIAKIILKSQVCHTVYDTTYILYTQN